MGDRRNSDISQCDDAPPFKRSRNTVCGRVLDENSEYCSGGVLNRSATANCQEDPQMHYFSSSVADADDALAIMVESITECIKYILHPVFLKFAEIQKLSMQNIQAPANDGESGLFKCVCKCHQQAANKGSAASAQKDCPGRSLNFYAKNFQEVIRNGAHAAHSSGSFSKSTVFNYPTANSARVPEPIPTSFLTPGNVQRLSEDCTYHQQAIYNRFTEENTCHVVADNPESSNSTLEENTSEVVVDNRESINSTSGNDTGVYPQTTDNRSARGNISDVITDIPESSYPTLEKISSQKVAGNRESSISTSGNIAEDVATDNSESSNPTLEKNTSKVFVDNRETNNPTSENNTGVHQQVIYNRSAGKSRSDVGTDDPGSSNPTLEKNTSEAVVDNRESSNVASGNISGVHQQPIYNTSDGKHTSEFVTDNPESSNPTLVKNPSEVGVGNKEAKNPTSGNISGVYKQATYNRSAGKNTSDVITDNQESSNTSLVKNTSDVVVDVGGSSNPTSESITGLLNIPVNLRGFVKLTCSSCTANYDDVTAKRSSLIVAKCGHILCRACSKKLSKNRESCPMCNLPVRIFATTKLSL